MDATENRLIAENWLAVLGYSKWCVLLCQFSSAVVLLSISNNYKISINIYLTVVIFLAESPDRFGRSPQMKFPVESSSGILSGIPSGNSWWNPHKEFLTEFPERSLRGISRGNQRLYSNKEFLTKSLEGTPGRIPSENCCRNLLKKLQMESPEENPLQKLQR